jgi:hypothetical protein
MMVTGGEDLGEGLGGVAVAAGHGVGEDVEGGRRSGVADSLDTVAIETPAASIWVAMKWRIVQPDLREPGVAAARMNRLVTRFGRDGRDRR